jgi:hypothetical protein
MERVILDRAEVLSLIDVSRSCREVHVLHSELEAMPSAIQLELLLLCARFRVDGMPSAPEVIDVSYKVTWQQKALGRDMKAIRSCGTVLRTASAYNWYTGSQERLRDW